LGTNTIAGKPSIAAAAGALYPDVNGALYAHTGASWQGVASQNSIGFSGTLSGVGSTGVDVTLSGIPTTWTSIDLSLRVNLDTSTGVAWVALAVFSDGSSMHFSGDGVSHTTIKPATPPAGSIRFRLQNWQSGYTGNMTYHALVTGIQ